MSRGRRTGGAPLLLGITGAIASGKSTASAFLRSQGIPVWDADAAVARLYGKNRRGSRALVGLAPQVIRDGRVDRAALRAAIAADPDLLARVEGAVLPLLAASRRRFLSTVRRKGALIAAYELPLPPQEGEMPEVTFLLQLSVPPGERDQRLALRPGLNPAFLARIHQRQARLFATSRRPDFTIDTGPGLADTRARLGELLTRLRKKARHA